MAINMRINDPRAHNDRGCGPVVWPRNISAVVRMVVTSVTVMTVMTAMFVGLGLSGRNAQDSNDCQDQCYSFHDLGPFG